MTLWTYAFSYETNSLNSSVWNKYKWSAIVIEKEFLNSKQRPKKFLFSARHPLVARYGY